MQYPSLKHAGSNSSWSGYLARYSLALLIFGRLLLLFTFIAGAHAQVYLPLSEITPGTERVQLVYNGGLASSGAEVDGYPSSVGWDRIGEMFVGDGTNTVPQMSGSVAKGFMPGAGYQQLIQLEPNTTYVLSAYLWNMGDAANHATTVVDLNDADSEAQLTLYHHQPNADHGYFAYQTFNTAQTGTTLLVRLFFDGVAGMGSSPPYHPLVAQWDNIAITKLSWFQAPATKAAGGPRRPEVEIALPLKNQQFTFRTLEPSLNIIALSSAPGGKLQNVEFFANSTKIGEAAGHYVNLTWSNLVSGSYVLTAVATDDNGAATLSAPVPITITISPPELVSLHTEKSGNEIALSWPTNATALSLLTAPDLQPGTPWTLVEELPETLGPSHLLTIPLPETEQYFRLGHEVDATTLDRKLLMGYQGWFAAPDDGSAPDRWVHWFRNQTPTAENATVDFWPDVSELEPDELFPTAMTLPDGNPAHLYSAYKQKTVERHFKWMKDYHLDGVFLQRFASELNDPTFLSLRNQVLANVKSGAENYGRVWAVMYDISGHPAETLYDTLVRDWFSLNYGIGVTNSPRYLRHNGKPVVAIWGFGFSDRPGTPAQAQAVIDHFRAQGLTVMGGVPTYWRTLNNDSKTDPAWADVYRSFDILSPWAVGRYGTLPEADSFRQNLIAPDLLETNAQGIEYMPVIFPGFSWSNLTGGPLNQIPRRGGIFYWRQAYNAVAAGCTMIYGAMFDEVDEGTSMFKMAPTPSELPAQGTFVPLNIDGQNLPSDWYLQVADHAGRMLRREIPLQLALPIRP